MPPIYSKTNPADAPILTLALTSKTMPLQQVEDYADTRLAQKISQLSGVGAVTISGGRKPAVRIQANPTQLASYGLNLEDLRTAIEQHQRRCGKGQLRRAAPGISDQCQRPAINRQGLQRRHCRVQEQRSGHAEGCGERGGRRRKRKAVRLDE